MLGTICCSRCGGTWALQYCERQRGVDVSTLLLSQSSTPLPLFAALVCLRRFLSLPSLLNVALVCVSSSPSYPTPSSTARTRLRIKTILPSHTLPFSRCSHRVAAPRGHPCLPYLHAHVLLTASSYEPLLALAHMFPFLFLLACACVLDVGFLLTFALHTGHVSTSAQWLASRRSESCV